MKLADKEIWVNGHLGLLYGFDWDTNEAVYRFVVDGEAKYMRVSLEDSNHD